MKKLIVIAIALFISGCATRTEYVYVKVKPKKTAEQTKTHTGGPEAGQDGEREKDTESKKEIDNGAKAPEGPITEEESSSEDPKTKKEETSTPTPESNRKLIGAVLEEVSKEEPTQTQPDKSPQRIEPVVSTVPRTVGSELEPGELKINGIDTCNTAPVACVQIEAVCPVQNPGCKESGYRYVSVAGNAREYTVMADGGGHTKLTCVATAEVDDLYVKNLEDRQRVRVVWMRRTNMCEPQVESCHSAAPRVLDVMGANSYVSGNRPVQRATFACR